MDRIAFLIYRHFALPLIFALAKGISFFQIKNKFFETLKFRLDNEFHIKSTFDPMKKSVGIHAASGEIEYALPLIRKIKQLHPNYNIVVTLSSTSVLKAVMNQSDVDVVGPSPIDLPWFVSQFLKKFQFRIFLFARTDVWPELNYQLNTMKVPTYIFSATFSETSAKKGRLTHSLTRNSFNSLKKIFAVSEADKKNLERIGIKTPILVTGDTRFDQVFHKQTKSKKEMPNVPVGKKILVAGSTWPEDETVVLQGFLRKSNQWRLIIAPHEVQEDTLLKIESFFKRYELKTSRLSQVSKNQNEVWDVLIADLYGYLFYLYEYADLAFVGGSFKAKVHSVMEPLSFFKPVCVGPFFKNNREAVEFNKIQMNFISTNWVHEIDDANELENLLSLHTKLTPSEKEKLTRDLGTLINQHIGATERVYQEISFIL